MLLLLLRKLESNKVTYSLRIAEATESVDYVRFLTLVVVLGF